MLHQINTPRPMDLPSERLILTLKISPYDNHYNPSLQMLTENNAVTKGYCYVDDGKWLA